MNGHPLDIHLSAAGKRHGRQWILRDIDFRVPGGTMCVLLGANGSGKSSLLRMMCGFDRPSEGRIEWTSGAASVDAMSLPLHIAYCAPDQDLIADLSVLEHIRLHRSLRRTWEGLSENDCLELAILETKGDTRVGDLSSGMRQRLALALALVTQSSGLFLDEPTSHLDGAGRQWYGEQLERWRHGRTVVVASNHNAVEFPGADLEWELPQL